MFFSSFRLQKLSRIWRVWLYRQHFLGIFVQLWVTAHKGARQELRLGSEFWLRPFLRYSSLYPVDQALVLMGDTFSGFQNGENNGY
jgi:hypothetical protein